MLLITQSVVGRAVQLACVVTARVTGCGSGRMLEGLRRTVLVRVACTSALLVPLVALGGCGGATKPISGPDTTNATTTQAAQSTTTAATQATAAVEAPHRTSIAFSLTDSLGWKYQGTIPFPEQELAFAKSVESSPPGQAQVVMSWGGEQPEPLTFDDTNPGRPDGPVLTVKAEALVYPVARIVEMKEGEQYPCRWGGTSRSIDNEDREHSDPFHLELHCQLVSEGGTKQETDSVPEREVEDFISDAQHETRWVEFVFAEDAHSTDATHSPEEEAEAEAEGEGECAYYVSTSGAVRRASEFAQGACLPVHLKVTQ